VRFQGKVAIVTGGSQGMGEACIRGFAKEGAKVAIFDIKEAEGMKVAEDLKSKGVDASFFKVDVTNRPQVNEAVKAVEQKYGKVDILVNVAGGDWVEPFVQSTEETWEKVIALNYKGMIYCTRAVLDGMIERNYGKIVNIASDAGRVGSKGEAVYSGCKAGVIAFGKTLARELGRNKINVNSVSPGPTETPSMKEHSVGKEKLIEALAKGIPMGRMGRSEDIAAAVLFFASDEAEYITGQVLSVSGGLNMV